MRVKLMLVWQRLTALFKLIVDKEPCLQINGSKILFKSSGDLRITAGRHLIFDYKLCMLDCSNGDIQTAIATYEREHNVADMYVTEYPDNNSNCRRNCES